MTTGLQPKTLDQEERLTSNSKVIGLVLVRLCLNWTQQHTDMKMSLLPETIGSKFVILKIAFGCRSKKPHNSEMYLANPGYESVFSSYIVNT